MYLPHRELVAVADAIRRVERAQIALRHADADGRLRERRREQAQHSATSKMRKT